MYIPRAILPPLLVVGVANAAYTCVDFTVPMSFTFESLTPVFPKFENHYQTVAFLNAVSARNAASAPSPFGDSVNITMDVEIATRYCYPTHGDKSSVVQVLTHGIGFDHEYWNLEGPDSEYNYIKTATDAGYSTLSYDRIGSGKSTITDPYTHQQIGAEVAVLATLTTLLREGKLSKLAKTHIPTPSKVAHIGHSYGSSISETLVGAAPSLSDCVVLTGWTSFSIYGIAFAISSNLHIAAETDPDRFGNLSKGYLTWGDELANQYSFLHYPNFDPEVLRKAEANKMPFAISEFLTAFGTPSHAWNGPLLVCSPTIKCY